MNDGRSDLLLNNTVTSSSWAVFVGGSAELKDNRIHDSLMGLAIFTPDEPSTLTGNTIDDTRYGFYICCSKVTEYKGHDIDDSNTVNGKPIVYLDGVSDRVVDASDDPATVIVVDSTNVTVRDVAINNSYVGVQFAGTTDSRVENVTVHDNKQGILLRPSSHGNRIANNTVTNSGDLGTFGPSGIVLLNGPHNNVVTGNTISNMGYAGILLWWNAQENRVIDNDVTDVTSVGIYLDTMTHADNVVEGNTVTDGAGSGLFTWSDSDGDVIRENVFERNNDGINIVMSEDHMLRDNRMDQNKYNFRAENVHDIDTSNTVDGKPIFYLVDAQDEVIDGSSDAGYVGIVDSQNVTVRDLNLSNTGYGVLLEGSTHVDISNTTVAQSVIGVRSLGSDNVSVENATVTDAAAYGVQDVGGADLGVSGGTFTDHGNIPLRLHDVEDAQLDANRVDAHTNWTDIYITKSDHVNVSDNHVANATFGIVSQSSQKTTIRGNTVVDTAAAITSHASTDDQILSNEARDNGFGVIGWGSSPGLEIAGNVFAENGNGTALNVTASAVDSELEGTTISLRGNEIRDNARAGVLVLNGTTPDDLAIQDNVIEGNGAYGVDATTLDGTLDARDNYWGAADGPSSPDASDPLEDPVTGALADGGGDAVSEGDEEGVSNVRFDPWLT